MSNNAIEIKNLSKSYSDYKLDDVSFNLPSGAIMGFIGQNGAGKSTTIKAILNLIKRENGEIKIFGKDNITHETEVKERMGVVFDDLYYSETFTLKNIDKVMRNIYKKWSSDEFFGYAKRFGLPEKKKIKEFSRGMKMKTSIAAALSHKADLLVLDEPTSGLDPIVRNEILDLLQDFVIDENHSILFSSHITGDLDRIADYLTFIHDGKVYFSKNKLDLLESHGVIKCSPEEFEKLDKSLIVASRKSTYGIEALTNDKEKILRENLKLVIDTPQIDDIMIFYKLGATK